MAKVRKNVYIDPQYMEIEDLDDLIRSMLALGAKATSDPELVKAIDLARAKQPGIIGLESLLGWIVVDWSRLREDGNGGRMSVLNEILAILRRPQNDDGRDQMMAEILEAVKRLERKNEQHNNAERDN